MISLCSDWEFTREWSAGFSYGEGRYARVSLPHTAGEVPLHYAKPDTKKWTRLSPCPICTSNLLIFIQS